MKLDANENTEMYTFSLYIDMYLKMVKKLSIYLYFITILWTIYFKE